LTTWLHELSLVSLTLLALGVMLAIAALIYAMVFALGSGARVNAFRAVSPGLLPPLRLLFGLLIGFLAAQAWSDHDRARQAVDHEASSLRSVVLLARSLPAPTQARVDRLVRLQIEGAVNVEWPAMGRGAETLAVAPAPLADLLELVLGLRPRDASEQVAQRELVTSVESAFDARRARVDSSRSSFNWAKWIALYALAVLTLVAIAFVHCGNRLSAALALGLFAAAAAVCVVVIGIQDRPFAGPYRVRPDVLVQVEPPR
jgi:uncharacterized protein DUF4239